MSLFLFRYVGRRIFCPGKIVAHHAEEFVRILLVELDVELGKSWRRICTYTTSVPLDVELGKVCLHWGLRSRAVSSTRIRMGRFAEH